jgi:hypothetical protein
MTESPGQLDTRITVTSAVLCTPETTIMAMAEPFTDVPKQASSVQTTHAFTRMPAPDTTGVVYQLLQPESESVSQSDQSGSTKKHTITGAIIGSVCLVVIVLMLLAIFHGKWRKPSTRSRAEEGRSGYPDQRSTNDIIEEAHRHRSHRNSRSREQAFQLSSITHGHVTKPTKAQCSDHNCANSQVSYMGDGFDRADLPE